MANIKYRKSDGTYETITNYNVQPLVPVQETGDSVIDVMSQKAVTDALNNLSAKGYEYNEDNVSFYIGDKEDAKKLINTASLTNISGMNLLNTLSDESEVETPLFNEVYWDVNSPIIHYGENENDDGIKGIILKIKNSNDQIIAKVVEQDKDSNTLTLDKEIPFGSEDAFIYQEVGAYGKCSLSGPLGVASGFGSVGLGIMGAASGIYSSNKGVLNYAWGDFSHAEGVGTIVEGQAGHSEGFMTRSIGAYSHSEGVMNSAIGECSHVEGNQVISYGNSSHAEGIGKDFLGINVIISGTELTIDSIGASMGTPNSLVINKNNTLIPFKVLSENEGIYTIDRDLGQYNGLAYIHFGLSYGEGSHAEGCSISIGDCSHSEGNGNAAFGNNSHAEGCLANAFGSNSHVEGYSSQAYGEGSHAEGNNTTANGNYSHTEGDETIANNYAEHAEGRYNVSNIDTIHSIGIGNSTNARQNAHEIMLNGDHYIYGIGDYDGTNPNDSQTLQQVINNQQDIIYTRTYTLDFGETSELVQDMNMIGDITISNILLHNVNKLYITYGSVVKSEVTILENADINIDKNTRIVWEIERINDTELACVGIEYKIKH